jgi:hypothetical protein
VRFSAGEQARSPSRSPWTGQRTLRGLRQPGTPRRNRSRRDVCARALRHNAHRPSPAHLPRLDPRGCLGAPGQRSPPGVCYVPEFMPSGWLGFTRPVVATRDSARTSSQPTTATRAPTRRCLAARKKRPSPCRQPNSCRRPTPVAAMTFRVKITSRQAGQKKLSRGDQRLTLLAPVMRRGAPISTFRLSSSPQHA